MASLKLIIDHKPLADSQHTIQLRITIMRTTRFLRLGEKTKKTHWTGKGFVTDNHPNHLQLNGYLSQVMATAHDVMIEMKRGRKTLTADNVRNAIARQINTERKTTGATFEAFATEQIVGQRCLS